MNKIFFKSNVIKTVVFAVLLLIQFVLLANAACSWWAYRNNTLFGNDQWISGKDTGKFVFYSYEFLFRSFEKNRVNLSEDMGFQEILYAKKEGPDFKLERLQAEVHVAQAAYLWVELRKEGLSLLGCRLSNNDNFPGGFYIFGKDGEIVEYTSFKKELPSLNEHWRKIDLRLADGVWVLNVDGTEYGRVADPPVPNGYFGFKGSGNTHAAVLVKNISMTMRDPGNPDRIWTDHQKFQPGNIPYRLFLYAFVFAVLALTLRRLRSRIYTGFLAHDQRDLFMRIENVGLVVLLIALALFPLQNSGIQLHIFVLIAEIMTIITLMVLRRKRTPVAYERPQISSVLYGVLLVSICGAAFAFNAESIGRHRDDSTHRMAEYHSGSYIVYPSESQSSGAYDDPGPVTILPGKPLLTESRVYREQLIKADFFMPANCTMDVVFQQRSYLTLGDPDGERLPLQRRLVRLTTRDDVQMGLATQTGNRPAPFMTIAGKILPENDNHIEIRSDNTGLHIVLNDEETVVPHYKPLGFGETGFMVFDAPVTLRHIRVEATTGQALRETLLPFLGVALPFILGISFLFLLRIGGRVGKVDAVIMTWAASYPLVFYLAAVVFLGQDTLNYLGHARFVWLDLAILGAVISLLVPLVLFGRRYCAFRFNLWALAVILFMSVLIWDLLPENNALKLRFTTDAVVPGEIVQEQPGMNGPWYSNNRLIGASTYVWRQQFGAQRPAIPKPSGETRAFVMGGSQAWGSGAASSYETFGDLLEKKLVSKGLSVKVYNAAVNGGGIGKVLLVYRHLVRVFEPDMVIADIGLNDSAAIARIGNDTSKTEHIELLLSQFKELLELCRKDGVDLVLCLEAMCFELPLRPDVRLYEGLEALAVEYNVPVLKPMVVTREKEKDHLVWWDTAHYAPYGHHLLAGLLETTVKQVIQQRIEQKTLFKIGNPPALTR